MTDLRQVARIRSAHKVPAGFVCERMERVREGMYRCVDKECQLTFARFRKSALSVCVATCHSIRSVGGTAIYEFVNHFQCEVCGRRFSYFSEDRFLIGKEDVRIQVPGVVKDIMMHLKDFISRFSRPKETRDPAIQSLTEAEIQRIRRSLEKLLSELCEEYRI